MDTNIIQCLVGRFIESQLQLRAHCPGLSASQKVKCRETMNMPLRNFQIPFKFQWTFKELSYIPSSCRHSLLEVLFPNHPVPNDHSLETSLQSMHRILTEVQIKKLTEFQSLKSFTSTYLLEELFSIFAFYGDQFYPAWRHSATFKATGALLKSLFKNLLIGEVSYLL